jgi:hypothetical protein
VAIVEYESLSEDLQDVVRRTKRRVGDTNDLYPFFEDEDDSYADMLAFVVGEINLTPPVITNYTVGNTPSWWLPLLDLGLTVETIRVKISEWVESPRLQGFTGPYADTTEYFTRWSTRLAQIEPIYKEAKKSIKILNIPAGVGSVDTSSFYGTSASQVPILRPLPSWFYNR